MGNNNKLKQEEPALLSYFSTDACNVCKVLKPKVDELIQCDFPKLKMVYVRSHVLPEVAGQHQVLQRRPFWFFLMDGSTSAKAGTLA